MYFVFLSFTALRIFACLRLSWKCCLPGCATYYFCRFFAETLIIMFLLFYAFCLSVRLICSLFYFFLYISTFSVCLFFTNLLISFSFLSHLHVHTLNFLTSTAESLFFIYPVPMSAPNLQLSDCRVPDIPEAQVNISGNQGTNLDYCLIRTERGSFSSGRVDVSTPQPGK